MYQAFYELREAPFELTSNPRYLFLSVRQREALSVLQYGLMAAKSLTLLVGEAGTGKTTLLRSALESERCRTVKCVYLNNPMLTGPDFVGLLARRFDLAPDASRTKSLFLDHLETALRQRRASGEITALVVDEAQGLSTELLEELRLLANIETASEKLLPLVLAGQPELAVRLERPELRQLKQRVALRSELIQFDLADTAAYISSRLTTAGGRPASIFSQEAVTLIHECSKGIPRSINVICDNALVSGMAHGRRLVDRAIVSDVCRELRLTPYPVRPAAAVAGPVASPIYARPLVRPELKHSGAEPAEDPARETAGARSRFGFSLKWRSNAPARSNARILTE